MLKNTPHSVFIYTAYSLRGTAHCSTEYGNMPPFASEVAASQEMWLHDFMRKLSRERERERERKRERERVSNLPHVELTSIS